VVWRHALRGALGPLVTLAGVDLGGLLGGAVVVEVIFSWPGLGRELMLASSELDIPVLLGVVLVGAIAVGLANLGADLIVMWLDPRARASSAA
jgi:ABC-type dipeptide/oligopeptide/nickel transport system permease component